MQPSFHLSLPVPRIEESVDFFTSLLGATVTHRDARYVNLELCGVQLTLTIGDAPPPSELHFGVNLPLADFDALAARLQIEPLVVDAGTPLERRKLYVRCPAGYRIEVKGYA
ncbi:MAG TPA: VOC family protein [Thermoanaerobaculia bacterium]